MNIKIKKNWEIKENKVTDEKVFFSRRNVVKGLQLDSGETLKKIRRYNF